MAVAAALGGAAEAAGKAAPPRRPRASPPEGPPDAGSGAATPARQLPKLPPPQLQAPAQLAVDLDLRRSAKSPGGLKHAPTPRSPAALEADASLSPGSSAHALFPTASRHASRPGSVASRAASDAARSEAAEILSAALSAPIASPARSRRYWEGRRESWGDAAGDKLQPAEEQVEEGEEEDVSELGGDEQLSDDEVEASEAARTMAEGG